MQNNVKEINDILISCT